MAVKRYDGSAWQTVAGLGAQGPAATSSSIATWVKTASGGETSLSGNDDNSQSLSYTVGQELVFINGTLLKRGSDYTATTGTSITGLTALAANDVATVWTVNAFSVTNAISNTLVDAKGDLVTASGADVPARLAVGSNGQVLTADSTTGTGLKWAAASGGLTLITNQAFTTVSSYSLPANTFSATYNNYEIILDVTAFSANNTLGARLRSGSTDYSDGQYLYQELSATGGSASANTAATGNTSIQVGDVNSATNYQMKMTLFKPNVTIKKWYFVDSIQYTSAGAWKYIKGSGRIDTASAYDSMSFIPSSGTMTGRVYVYGYNI